MQQQRPAQGRLWLNAGLWPWCKGLEGLEMGGERARGEGEGKGVGTGDHLPPLSISLPPSSPVYSPQSTPLAVNQPIHQTLIVHCCHYSLWQCSCCNCPTSASRKLLAATSIKLSCSLSPEWRESVVPSGSLLAVWRHKELWMGWLVRVVSLSTLELLPTTRTNIAQLVRRGRHQR